MHPILHQMKDFDPSLISTAIEKANQRADVISMYVIGSRLTCAFVRKNADLDIRVLTLDGPNFDKIRHGAPDSTKRDKQVDIIFRNALSIMRQYIDRTLPFHKDFSYHNLWMTLFSDIDPLFISDKGQAMVDNRHLFVSAESADHLMKYVHSLYIHCLYCSKWKTSRRYSKMFERYGFHAKLASKVIYLLDLYKDMVEKHEIIVRRDPVCTRNRGTFIKLYEDRMTKLSKIRCDLNPQNKQELEKMLDLLTVE